MGFQIHGLEAAPFKKFFEYSESDLKVADAQLQTVSRKPGTPCRVSLTDAEVGETVLLINYEHQPEASPFRSSHAIFIRKGAVERRIGANEVPDVLSSRILSIRGFDQDHCMRDADVVDGKSLSEAIERMFANDIIEYIHLHNAKPGCFAARVTRS